jgi:hypothetical protein
VSDPVAAREALMIEAIGEAGQLIDSVTRLAPTLQDISREIVNADASLRNNLSAFEGRMAAITENAKTKTVQHLAVRTEEAARRSIDQQARAMADAAQVAFGVEIGATLRRLKSMVDQSGRGWERGLTYAAVATASSSVTWVVTIWMLGR